MSLRDLIARYFTEAQNPNFSHFRGVYASRLEKLDPPVSNRSMINALAGFASDHQVLFNQFYLFFTLTCNS